MSNVLILKMQWKIFYFHIFFILLVKKYLFVFAQERRSDVDLQVCLNNFNIKLDEIIRTQDSQQMGAKYLNEVDLGSREECLRLCCETDECDVFVFEEKKSGSCYLFHCGPPDNFKCKFTHHANYSSAMLSVSRSMTDIESQMRHEQDLTNLRKQEKETSVFKPVAMPIQILQTTSTTPKPIILGYPKVNVRKCSRFQFECRSTSECIAIYNACDGIPQCEDGSDEAPELDCPNSVVTSAPPVPTPMKSSEFIKYGNKVQLPFIQPENLIQKAQIYQSRQPPILPLPVPKPDPNFIRPNEEADTNYRIQYNMNMQPHPLPIQREMNWISPQANQIVPQVNLQNKVESPHIESKPPIQQPKHVEQKIPLKHKVENHQVHHEDYPNIGYYHADSNDAHDGMSTTPMGATLSVAVGVMITAVMALMLGCRLKMVRRRIRRDGKGYSHDADFLVNGMYL